MADNCGNFISSVARCLCCTVSTESPADPEYEKEAREFINDSDQSTWNSSALDSKEGDWTPEDYLSAPADLRGQILAQLFTQRLSKDQLRVAATVLNALDSRGFFTEDVEECAEECGATAEEFAHVLGIVQQCEPAGVAARNSWHATQLVIERNGSKGNLEWCVASCLAHLSQTGELRALTAGASSAMTVTDCECLARELAKALAYRLGIGQMQARHIMKSLVKSAPHPAEQHEEDVTPWSEHHAQPVEDISPDVEISALSDGSTTVALCGSRYKRVAISKSLLAEVHDQKQELDSLRDHKNLVEEAGTVDKDKTLALAIAREQKEECREHVTQFPAG